MAFNLVRELYALDTLDTRFVVPATTPPKHARDDANLDPAAPLPVQNGQRKCGNAGHRLQPARWHTPEFYFYYVSILASIVFMFHGVLHVSHESHPNYSNFSHLLSDGWIPGRRVDNTDAQYSGFRQNLPYLFLVILLHPVLRRGYDSFWPAGTYTQVRPPAGLTMALTPSPAADARLSRRISFDVLFAGIFLAALHGFSAFKILAILYANYCIAMKLPRTYVPAATWIFNIGTLFANDFSRGYSYATIVGIFLPSASSASEKQLPADNFGHVLDSFGGLIPRWEVLFNFTILRLISFNLDYYWSLNARAASPLEKKQLDPSNLSERDRVTIPAKPTDFSFRNYLAYTMYSPLYLAGPILTFNDYIAQQRHRPHTITRHRTTLYAIRFVVVLLTMELMIHYMYMVAIFHAKPNWSAYTPSQLSMLGFFNLKHIWLKLLIPWRLFRLWALLDGVDAPENMVRCMSDNYSVQLFWRGWHRSFNKWTLRYLYIPLGGSALPGLWGKARVIANYLAVFTFIAVWHDIQLRLLMWGWLVTLFVLPEIAAAYVFPARRWKDSPDAYRWLCGVGAVGEILLLMTANLVGFALGVDGFRELVKGIAGSYSGWAFLVTACGALFTGVQFMFEWREREVRSGVRMKC